MSERHLAPGRVLTRHPLTLGECIGCGLDAEGHTLTTWCWDGPGETYPMCFWCLELWDANGWLRTDEEWKP